MDAVLPVTDAQDPDQLTLIFPASRRGDGNEEEEDGNGDDGPSVPYNPYGVIFLRPIMLVQVPRMRAGGPGLSEAAFKYLFGKPHEEIVHGYYRVGFLPRQPPARDRVVTNKSTRTVTYIPEPGMAQPILFNFAQMDVTLPPPAFDGGSDLEDEGDNPDEGMGIDETITQLYHQFLIDIMAKSPNPKGARKPSYCVLSADARSSITEDLFKTRRLPEVWRACQYKRAGLGDFRVAFDHLFPRRDHRTGAKVQNYLQCQYYMKWKEICATADAHTVSKVHTEIWNRVSKFIWLPHAMQERIWATNNMPRFMQYPPNSSPYAPAPHILIRKEPEWQLLCSMSLGFLLYTLYV